MNCARFIALVWVVLAQIIAGVYSDCRLGKEFEMFILISSQTMQMKSEVMVINLRRFRGSLMANYPLHIYMAHFWPKFSNK